MDVLNRLNRARLQGSTRLNRAAAWHAWALALAIPAAPAATLSFEELVDCRTAVEAVYWRHRIWPESNTTPKPPLAEVLPRKAIVVQVETMLGKAAALEERWHRPITPEAMRAELERMARDSQAPEVLKELFSVLETGERAALCLALPELVERWIDSSYAWDAGLHRDAAASAEAAVAALDDLEWQAASGAVISDRTFVRRTDLDPGPDPGWEPGEPTPLDPAAWDELTAKLLPAAGAMTKARHAPWGLAGSSIDFGLERPEGRVLEETADGFLVREVREAEADRLRVVSAHWAKEPLARWWQREAKKFAVSVPDASGIVMPRISAPACTDGTWTPTRVGFLPSARWFHSAVWTGTEMIVWGGEEDSGAVTATGGRYHPATDTWTPTPPESMGAPAARSGHTAVWTGTQMIVWGGFDGNSVVATGGRYTPGTNAWTPTSGNGAPGARTRHTAVWTGTQMIVWGGFDGSGVVATGGRYTPGSNTWTPTDTGGAPEARYLHTAVWTGTQMIVWGGLAAAPLNSGGRYTPATNTWAATAKGGNDPPAPRRAHSAVWTGSEMIIWGGVGLSTTFGDGSRYDPGTNTWFPTSFIDEPSPRSAHSAVWTGTEMIVWGGKGGGGGSLDTGGRYDPMANTWASTAASGRPPARWVHTAVWTGNEMIVWGGTSGDAMLNSGGRYNPAGNTWSRTSENAAPTARAHHTAVWTGSEMIVWGGSTDLGAFLNTGGRYSAATDSWRPTATSAGVPSPRNQHSAVWTGARMIIFGGFNTYDGFLNSGGAYEPASDDWDVLPTGVAARSLHTAVWTGSEMIVWGGRRSTGPALQSGGRYDPDAQMWTDTALVNAPEARTYHTAVWTGTEMIVWGGGFNTGGRYFPLTDSWSPTFTGGAPSARYRHVAVWTGSEMIVWGGRGGNSGEFIFNTGGRYRPLTDDWQPTPTAGAPAPRESHTAAWTGTEMIVWGGWGGLIETGTGAIFVPGNDAWKPMATSGAPGPRFSHTAVWTGSQMIVWGGAVGSEVANTGGRYCALPAALLFANGFESG